MKIQLKIFAAMFCVPIAMQAQSLNNNVIASGGTLLKSGNVQLEYTVGEALTNTLSSASNKITQGFHQPNILVARINGSEGEIQNVPSNNRITNNTITYHFDVYPNPATDFVNVRINQSSETKFKMMLVDETGKLIRSDEFTQTETQIDFTKLASGKYFITIKTDDGKIKESFKVIKLN